MEKGLRVAVIGGSGKIGKYLINHLIKNEIHTKVLLRDPDKLQITNNFIEKIKGNVRVYQDVYSLIEGCDVVISTLGQAKGEDHVFSVATENIIKAMNNLNIKRYIVVAGLGLNAGKDNKCFKTKLLSAILRLFFPSIIKDKQHEYSLLLKSNLDWTIVRLPFVKLNNLSEKVKVSLTDCPGNKINANDLADFLFNQINDRSYIKQAPFISN